MWFWVTVAVAGVPEDIATAADTDLPTDLRKQAFDRAAQPDSVPVLTRLAEDASTPKPQRWVAIRALGPIQDDTARAALLHFLAASDAAARMAALGAIGDRGDATMWSYAANKLADPALLVRAAAADALLKLKDPRALPGASQFQPPSSSCSPMSRRARTSLGAPSAPPCASTWPLMQASSSPSK